MSLNRKDLIRKYPALNKSIRNIDDLFECGICEKCYNYIPLQDDRIPIHFNCQRFYEFMDLPNAINEIHTFYDENNNLNCMSFIERKS